MFSTMKYVNAPNFEKFREVWQARYLNGFVVHNQAFDGLTGNFPIGFLIWQTNQSEITPITTIDAEVLNKDANPVGQKTFYSLPTDTYLNVWIKRQKANKTPVLPIKNAISPATSIATCIVGITTYNIQSRRQRFMPLFLGVGMAFM